MTVKAYSDIFVKYLLGSIGNEDILLSFINDVLVNSGFKKINSVLIKNPFNFQEFEGDKLSILDVKAIDETGKTYNIEVQVQGNETYKSRVLYYWSRAYTSQIKEGDSYSLLRPVISINVLNFNLINESDHYHNLFCLTKDTDTSIILTDHLYIHFLELPKLIEKTTLNHLEKWLYFLKYEGNKDMSIIIKDDEVFRKAHNEYKKFTHNDRLRELYESRIEAERRYITDIEFAEEKGIKIGEEKGIIIGEEKGIKIGEEKGIIIGEEKGKKEREIEIAKKMLEQGLDIQTINKITGLSHREIEKIKTEL